MKLIIRTKIEREKALKIIKVFWEVFKETSFTREGSLLLQYPDGDLLGLNYMCYVFENVCEVSQYRSNGNYHRIRINTETGDVLITHYGMREDFPEKLQDIMNSRDLETLQMSKWEIVLYSTKNPHLSAVAWLAGQIGCGIEPVYHDSGHGRRHYLH